MTEAEQDPRYLVIMDFLGWATSQDRELTLSSHHEAPPAIDALERYLRERPLAPVGGVDTPAQPELPADEGK